MTRFARIWIAFQRLRLAQRQYAKACERLARDVEQRRTRFLREHPEYETRRAAALKHEPRSWA